MYLTQSNIADNTHMTQRVAQCAATQGCADVSIDPDLWTRAWRRIWSASPDWDAAWESALASHPDDPAYSPGEDVAVITDEQILSQVQAMLPFRLL